MRKICYVTASILFAGCGLSDGEKACKTMCEVTHQKVALCFDYPLTDEELEENVDTCLDTAREIRDAEKASDEDMRLYCNAERDRITKLSCDQVKAEAGL